MRNYKSPNNLDMGIKIPHHHKIKGDGWEVTMVKRSTDENSPSSIRVPNKDFVFS